MTYYLDSSIIVSILRGKIPAIDEKMDPILPSKIKIPSMVKAELLAGAHRGRDAGNVAITIEFLTRFETISFDDDASEIYGRIWAELESKGNMIGSNDLIIAATVLSRGGILVTNNTKEFERVKGLHIEDWSK
jgi:tRNA(fMet)-specific endonuclease VapC